MIDHVAHPNRLVGVNAHPLTPWLPFNRQIICSLIHSLNVEFAKSWVILLVTLAEIIPETRAVLNCPAKISHERSVPQTYTSY